MLSDKQLFFNDLATLKLQKVKMVPPVGRITFLGTPLGRIEAHFTATDIVTTAGLKSSPSTYKGRVPAG
jgi:hypothetical protein